MPSAKDILIKPIARKDADRIVSQIHYSGRTVNNSQIHLGVFLGDQCGGVLQFGPSMDKRKIVGLVAGTKWNDFCELNRMALADWLPKNSESRAISVSMRLLKKNYPNLEWVVSFADAMRCGHGTIYQASGFILTGISGGDVLELADDLAKINGGAFAHRMSLQTKSSDLSREVLRRTGGKNVSQEDYVRLGIAKRITPGYMCRYLYFLNPDARQRLTVPELPFSRIKEMGAAMYRGCKVESVDNLCVESEPATRQAIQLAEGGSTPTSTLLQTEDNGQEHLA